MDQKLKIAVYFDYDNIEIGVKSTLHRDFDVALVLDALKERGEIVAKYAYANWERQVGATRQMSESAVQMVQRVPSPRGDKNGADINLALDMLEMAFTHPHINAFAVVSGDSDFISLVNKLREYGKRIFVVGGKSFTSTILQKNCHEFISYESLLMGSGADRAPGKEREGGRREAEAAPRPADAPPKQDTPPRHFDNQQRQRPPQQQQRAQMPPPLDREQVVPLVERALQVLERRQVQPELGVLKSTMLQLDPTFSERAYGSSSFKDLIEKLRESGFVHVTGGDRRYLIERKASAKPERKLISPEELIPLLRDLLEVHRLEMENGADPAELESWVKEAKEDFDHQNYGFQEFMEFLNFAQDKLLVRIEASENEQIQVFLGAEFYPPTDIELMRPTAEPKPKKKARAPRRELTGPMMMKAEPVAVKKAVRKKVAASSEPDAKPVRRRTRKAAEGTAAE